MGGQFEHIAHGLDLQEQDLVQALGDRDTTKGLLAHLAGISAPNTGSAKVLVAFARMATTACSWIDGDLSIDVVGDGDITVIEVATELGGGLRERVFAPMSFHVPIVEFARAIDRVPHMIVPLVIRTRSSRRILLSATEVLRRTTAPPPPIEISSESLFIGVSPPPVPRESSEDSQPSSAADDVDAGWED
jgi:hypothetical protein